MIFQTQTDKQNYHIDLLQVHSRGPDDKVYNAHEALRQKVARGNSILYIHNTENNSIKYDGVVFALRKFTGQCSFLNFWP